MDAARSGGDAYFEEMPIYFLPDRVCLPGKSGKFGSEVAICRDSHRAGWQEAARVWTQAA